MHRNKKSIVQKGEYFRTAYISIFKPNFKKLMKVYKQNNTFMLWKGLNETNKKLNKIEELSINCKYRKKLSQPKGVFTHSVCALSADEKGHGSEKESAREHAFKEHTLNRCNEIAHLRTFHIFYWNHMFFLCALSVSHSYAFFAISHYPYIVLMFQCYHPCSVTCVNIKCRAATLWSFHWPFDQRIHINIHLLAHICLYM